MLSAFFSVFTSISNSHSLIFNVICSMSTSFETARLKSDTYCQTMKLEKDDLACAETKTDFITFKINI